jgi:hypothetical protein
MRQLLITSALAEIKILKDRIKKKNAIILTPFVMFRSSAIIDPFGRDGGSEKVIASARKSVEQMEKNIVQIRTAIQKKNLESVVTSGKYTMTIAEWLIWRRDIYTDKSVALQQILARVNADRTKFANELAQVANSNSTEAQTKKAQTEVVNINQKALMEEIEDLEAAFGDIDQRLSIFNATTFIDIDEVEV